MAEIDWSKARNDATHWSKIGETFAKVDDVGLWYPSGFFWSLVSKNFSLADLVERPTTPSWSGEGLPPVGVDLECRFACEPGVWQKGKCVASGTDPEGRQGVAVVVVGDRIGCYSGEPGWMRPIKTPEQIAKDERKASIAEMVKSLGVDEPGLAQYICCERIYDAGYRKQEQPK